MKVHIVEYCPCVYESGYELLSIHTTKSGAYSAMKSHKLSTYADWQIMDKQFRIDNKWNDYMNWRIRTKNVVK